MIRTSLSLLLAALLALFLAQPAAAGSFHGVVTQGPLTATDYNLMGLGGVGSLRVPVTWGQIQPTLGGERNWRGLDSVVGQAAANGVQVLPTLHGPGPAGTQNPPTDPSSRAAMADFARALAARYGRGGDFWATQASDVPMTAFQIYNEQNGPAYWEGRPSPRAYGRMVKAAAAAIRAEDSGAEIVLGGMFGTPRGEGALTSAAYLSKLYRVPQIKQAFSTVAVHPYAPDLRGIKKQISGLRKVMKQNRDRGAKLRITEVGWGSGSAGSSDFNKGAEGQAQMLTELFGMLERKQTRWNIAGVNWYAWQDNSSGACSFCPTSGLFTEAGAPKPAWYAFVNVAGS